VIHFGKARRGEADFLAEVLRRAEGADGSDLPEVPGAFDLGADSVFGVVGGLGNSTFGLGSGFDGGARRDGLSVFGGVTGFAGICGRELLELREPEDSRAERDGSDRLDSLSFARASSPNSPTRAASTRIRFMICSLQK